MGRLGFEISSKSARLGFEIGCAFEITARLDCFGCARRFRCDFWSQVAPTWMPGPALIAIPLESGIEIHKSHISEKTVNNGACGAQVEAQVRQKFVKSLSRVCLAAPTERQSAPKWSLGSPNWCTFRTSWTTFAHYPSRLSRHALFTQNDPCRLP